MKNELWINNSVRLFCPGRLDDRRNAFNVIGRDLPFFFWPLRELHAPSGGYRNHSFCFLKVPTLDRVYCFFFQREGIDNGARYLVDREYELPVARIRDQSRDESTHFCTSTPSFIQLYRRASQKFTCSITFLVSRFFPQTFSTYVFFSEKRKKNEDLHDVVCARNNWYVIHEFFFKLLQVANW